MFLDNLFPNNGRREDKRATGASLIPPCSSLPLSRQASSSFESGRQDHGSTVPTHGWDQVEGGIGAHTKTGEGQFRQGYVRLPFGNPHLWW